MWGSLFFTLAKNFLIEDQGTDGGGYNDDTYEAVFIHGDPAFNPYTPNFEGLTQILQK